MASPFHTDNLGCHNPVVTDAELINRIQALNRGDILNGISAWKCGRCVKGKGNADQRTIPPADKVGHERIMTARSPSASGHDLVSATPNQHVGNASHPTHIPIDDDDVMIIDDPEPSRVPLVSSNSAPVHSGIYLKSTTHSIGKANATSAPRLSTSIPRTNNIGMIDLTLSSDEDEPAPPTRPPPQPPIHSAVQAVAQTDILNLQSPPQEAVPSAAQKPLLQSPHKIVPVPRPQQIHGQAGDNNASSSQIPAQYVYRLPTPPPVKANLAPTWFRERWAASIEEVDIWQRAHQKKTEARHRDPRRKHPSKPSGDATGDLFCFFASMWIDEQKKDMVGGDS